jgi:hypothetical protein
MTRTPEKSAEAIVGSATGTEGPNLEEKEPRSLPTARGTGAEKTAEKLEARRGKEIRKMEENL